MGRLRGFVWAAVTTVVGALAIIAGLWMTGAAFGWIAVGYRAVCGC